MLGIDFSCKDARYWLIETKSETTRSDRPQSLFTLFERSLHVLLSTTSASLFDINNAPKGRVDMSLSQKLTLGMIGSGAAAAVLPLLSGCAITPKTGPSCVFDRYLLQTKPPASTRELFAEGTRPRDVEPQQESDLTRELTLALAAPRARPLTDRPVEDSMLFLSGGSQHGAFGAGYLAEWQANSPNKHLPKFAVVTGVSTGAILSTFAFIDRADVPLKAYAITHERELLKPLVSMRNGSPTAGGYVGLVKKGAIADLAPLRDRLSEVITEQVLRDVATGAKEKRRLLVGVVDVDTGQAYALDLTKMAVRWDEAHSRNSGEAPRWKACYVEAIVASSSAPMAALPVLIDDRMYADGGMRFGAFSDEIGPAIENRRRALTPTVANQKPLRIYLIVNGYQAIASKCARADPQDCIPPGDPKGADPVGYGHPHGKWKFLNLALRSEQILANQVYLFSAESIGYKAAQLGARITYAKIDADAKSHEFDLDQDLGGGHMTCAQAEQKDREALDPIQFFPRYMRCIIDYGRWRADKEQREENERLTGEVR